MKSESDFKKWFCNTLRNECHVTTIETTTSRGVPDIHLCRNGGDVWVELKLFTGGRVLLRPEQHAWMTRRLVHDGRSCVVALHPSGLILISRYAYVMVVPHGKYLSVTGLNTSVEKNNVDLLKTILFT